MAAQTKEMLKASAEAVEKVRTGNALVAYPLVLSGRQPDRAPEACLEEAVGLAHAINLDVAYADIIKLKQVTPATLIGRGSVERLAEVVRALEIDVAIFDAALSPLQQRNLERSLNCKVIDRTGLILEIFGARARTKEGQLQVELAALSYQRSRLVRSWTHLERQRGGYGFLGGPGERQLEIDRRIIDDRIDHIKRDLEKVRRTRQLHRKARRRNRYPVIALVGYTNAGKSTLFNRLTRDHVGVADMLFATLDPTMRQVTLPSGRTAILSDTVGFISDLPPDLVAAFRATLEEVTEADILLHVRDVSHPDTEAQRRDVEEILRELVPEETIETRLVEVLNKADLLTPETEVTRRSASAREDNRVLCSALEGTGCSDVLAAVEDRLTEDLEVVTVELPLADGAPISWLYDHGHVLERQDCDGNAVVRVSLDPVERARFEQRFGRSLAT